MMRRKRGFTLIEVLAVLTVLGILAAIAYPAYARQIVKARRIEAQLALLDAMGRQEQHRALHHSYIAFSIDEDDPEASGFRRWTGASAADSAYELDGVACPDQDIAQCIELRATPGTGNVDADFADPDCGTLTLDSTGRQGASGPSPGCWP